MVKLIKCHFYYIFNKINISIISLTVLFVCLYSIINVISLDERATNVVKVSEFYLNSFQIVKVVGIFDAIFIMGYSFLNDNDSYRTIIVDNKITRTKYFISKVITLLLIISLIFISLCLVIFVLNDVFSIYMNKRMILSFIDLFICMWFYSFLVLIIILIIINIYMIFLVYLSSLINYNESFEYIAYFLPILKNNNLNLNYLYYLIIIIVLFCISLIIWNNSDL